MNTINVNIYATFQRRQGSGESPFAPEPRPDNRRHPTKGFADCKHKSYYSFNWASKRDRDVRSRHDADIPAGFDVTAKARDSYIAQGQALGRLFACLLRSLSRRETKRRVQYGLMPSMKKSRS